MRHKLTMSLLICSLCATAHAAESDQTTSAPKTTNAVLLWKDSCAEQADDKEGLFVASLLAALVPKIADAGIALLSKTFKDRAGEYQIAHVATVADTWGNARFETLAKGGSGTAASSGAELQLNLEKRCLLAYSGEAGPWKGVPSSYYPKEIRQLPSKPAFFLQTSIEYQTVGTRGVTFRVTAEKLALARATSRGRTPKDFVATIRFSIPGVIVTGGSIVETVLPPIPNVEIGDTLHLQGITSEWLSFPALSGALGEEFVIPATAFMRVLETDVGRGATLYSEISDVIQKSKDEVAKAIVDQTAKLISAPDGADGEE